MLRCQMQVRGPKEGGPEYYRRVTYIGALAGYWADYCCGRRLRRVSEEHGCVKLTGVYYRAYTELRLRNRLRGPLQQ